MNARLRIPSFVLLLALPAMAAGPKDEYVWECVDLNDVLPFGESSVRSLVVLPDGTVLGGCGGDAAHLFVFDPKTREVRDLKRWPRGRCVRNLVADASGRFWMIVGSQPGAILSDDAKIDDERIFAGSLKGGCLELTEAGAPFSDQGIMCLALDREEKRMYGIARPTPILFRYDLAAGVFEELARLGKRESHERALTWQAPVERVSKLPRALTVAPGGQVYGAWIGALFRWSPAQPSPKRKTLSRIIRLRGMSIPSASDRRRTEGTIVESFAWGSDGRLFGGTYDGYLFAADLAAEKIVNLGKPFRQGRIRALARDRGGRLFGLCGEDTGHCRLFSYADGEGYQEVEVPRRKPRGWFQCDTLDALAVAEDGTIYVGGSGRMTALYVVRPREGTRSNQ